MVHDDSGERGSGFRARMLEALDIEPSRTIVLTVDLQRKYLDSEVASAPVEPDEAERVVRKVGEFLSFARVEGIPVVHAYTTRRPIEVEHGFSPGAYYAASVSQGVSQMPHAAMPERLDRLAGSAESQVPASLSAESDIHVDSKKTMDAYLWSDLDMLLRYVLTPEHVLLCGVNTDTCVYATTFSTSVRGYAPVVLSDCVASTRGNDVNAMALDVMSRGLAWVVSLEQLRDRLG